jgi:ABC-type sugar transport system ATPase subunit
VVVLRGGKLAGERVTFGGDAQVNWAELMVGGQLPVNEIGPPNPGRVLFELSDISTRGVGGAALKNVSMQLRGGEITGLAGISGNGPSGVGGAHRRHAGIAQRRDRRPRAKGLQMVAACGASTMVWVEFPKIVMQPG